MRNHSGRKFSDDSTSEDNNNNNQYQRSGRSDRSQPARFLQTVERQLVEHPQIGAIILDGLVIACGRLSEFIGKFEQQLKQKVDELRGSQSQSGQNEQKMSATTSTENNNASGSGSTGSSNRGGRQSSKSTSSQ